MDIKEHTTPKNLFKYAFMWNQVRLVVAAASLILGGFPVALRIFSSSNSMVGSLLTLSWIISGVAALYLLYMWFQSGKKLWGGSERTDVAAFWVAIISGLHLGIAGILGTNIGMTVIPSTFLTLVMLVAGILYLWSAFHLHKRYSKSSDMFGGASVPAPSQPEPAAESTPEPAPEVESTPKAK